MEAAPLLPRGCFFGDSFRQLRTPSFELADRIARVPAREVPRHTHSDAHFVLVVEGTYETEAGNRPGRCGPSTVVFNPAGTTHRDRFHSDHGRFFTVSLTPEVASVVEARLPVSCVLAGPFVLRALQRLRAASGHREPLAELLLEGLGLEVAGQAAEWALDDACNAPAWLLAVRSSIQDRCTTGLTVAQLACEAQVHPIHVARSFRRHFACSPGDYLRRCRLERARHLLATTRLPLNEVALAAGFCDQSHLTRALRRASGVTPRELRRATES
jgi:AraC family transcriptional regulator